MHVAGHKQRPPLHPLERSYLAVVTTQLVLLPWIWGSMGIGGQVLGLGFGVLGLGLALIPRFYGPEYTQGPSFRLNPWPRLLRFPLFWLGLLLLILLCVQAANPFWTYARNDKFWWLVRVNDVDWLPVSIDVPFARFNVWRQFIVYATVWVTTCALWVGITRRKSLHILLGVLVANSILLGLVGFLHKASGEPKLLWIRTFNDAAPFASFIYRNHAGAYFGVLAFVALGLALWHFFEGRKRLARSTPAALCLMGSFFLVLAVIFSVSRGAILSVGVFGFAALLGLLFLRLTTATQSTTPAMVNVMVGVMVLGTIGITAREMDFSEVHQRFQELTQLQTKAPSVVSRQLAREAAIDMYRDHWLRGVGAGGFRHLYPEYVRHHPEIYQGGRFFWEHAHNDWLEIPIELGLTGVLLITAAVAWVARAWWRSGGRRHPLALMVVCGLGQTLLHALMDFPLQCPAILVTWWALVVISLRWLELDSHGAA